MGRRWDGKDSMDIENDEELVAAAFYRSCEEGDFHAEVEIVIAGARLCHRKSTALIVCLNILWYESNVLSNALIFFECLF